jgi:hypothetical protein
MKNDRFPITVAERGVSAKIGKVLKIKNGTSYSTFVVDYVYLGKRKQVWRTDLTEAKTVARDACRKISNGDHLALELKNTDGLTYLRAIQPLSPLGIELEVSGHITTLPRGACGLSPLANLRMERNSRPILAGELA